MRIIYVYSYIDVDIFIMRWNNRNFMILQRALHLWLAMYKWTRIIIWTIFSCCCNVCELTVYARQQKNNKKKMLPHVVWHPILVYTIFFCSVCCFLFYFLCCFILSIGVVCRAKNNDNDHQPPHRAAERCFWSIMSHAFYAWSTVMLCDRRDSLFAVWPKCASGLGTRILMLQCGPNAVRANWR